MKYIVCPRCKNLNTDCAIFCLFCGNSLKRNALRVPRESSGIPRVKRTLSFRFQSALFALAVLAAATAALLPSFSRNHSDAIAAIPPVLPVPTSIPAEKDVFSKASGTYAVLLYLSDVQTDDPATQSAADEIAGKRFDGGITLSVDSSGTGSIQIDQAFFSPKSIDVTAFQDEKGTLSGDTLYGITFQSGIKISVVCVCKEESISGFIWLDSAESHIEFLYFG